MPSALPSMTARSCARCRTTSSNAIALVSATPALAGEQLKQFELDVAELAPAVQRVQGPVGLTRYMRKAERDRVQAGQRRPDQVIEAARVPRSPS